MMAAEAANAVSLFATAVANTAANRRITLSASAAGLASCATRRAACLPSARALLLTSGALALLQAVAPHPSRLAELAVLLPANLLATLLRFVLYRGWVFFIAASGSMPTAVPCAHAMPRSPGKHASTDAAGRPPMTTAARTGEADIRRAGGSGGRRRWRWRGGEREPRWARPALAGLLAATAALYLIGLGRNGWANDFYAAAVQAGTGSWKAMFFGSFDRSNFITVDKPPGSLWVSECPLAFRLNSWSLLVPQALEGVAAVGLLYATVRRWFGPGAGLLAARRSPARRWPR